MGDEELIDALRRAHGAAAFAQAAEITAIREVYRRHRAANAEPGPGGVRAGEFAAAQVAVAVHQSEAVAAALIDIGLALDSLPRTRAAFAAGRIDLSRVQVIAEAMRGLAREVREALEPKLIDAATRTDPSRLRQTARRWIIRLDADGEQRRREERESDRDVRIRAVADGMAVFDGLLPAAGAQTIAMRLREMSLQVCEDDPRTMPQRRADALVALADGTGRLRCGCTRGKYCPQAGAPSAPRRPLIQVGMSAETLLGLRDDPAFLSGYGPVDAALARTLAEHARFQVIPEYFAEEPAPAAPAEPAIPAKVEDATSPARSSAEGLALSSTVDPATQVGLDNPARPAAEGLTAPARSAAEERSRAAHPAGSRRKGAPKPFAPQNLPEPPGRTLPGGSAEAAARSGRRGSTAPRAPWERIPGVPGGQAHPEHFPGTGEQSDPATPEPLRAAGHSGPAAPQTSQSAAAQDVSDLWEERTYTPEHMHPAIAAAMRAAAELADPGSPEAAARETDPTSPEALRAAARQDVSDLQKERTYTPEHVHPAIAAAIRAAAELADPGSPEALREAARQADPDSPEALRAAAAREADPTSPEALRAAALRVAGTGVPGAHPAGSKRRQPVKPAVPHVFSSAPPREIRAFDALCRFPGCTMPAAETLVAQFDPLRSRRAPQHSAAPRAVLCSHHHRLKALADSGKQPWRVYLADTDRMRWIDPTGEPHETVREGARYLFPDTDIDAPARLTRHLHRAPEVHLDLPIPLRPFTADIAYPVDTHVLLHPQLARTTPENDIPTIPARPAPR